MTCRHGNDTRLCLSCYEKRRWLVMGVSSFVASLALLLGLLLRMGW